MLAWKKVTVSGRSFEVFFATEQELVDRFGDKDTDRLDGYTDLLTSQIFVSEKLTPAHRDVIIVHELLHAILASSGILQWLDSSRKKGRIDDFEETLVHLLAPQLVDVFKSAGLWAEVTP